MLPPGSVICFDGESPFLLADPARIVAATSIAAIWPALLEVEDAVHSGLTAAGFVAYEAAPAFDAAMKVHPPSPLPLLWFGLYRNGIPIALRPADAFPLQRRAAWEEGTYSHAASRARDYIAAGNTYQVNLTFPMKALWQGDPLARFAAMHAAQPSPYAMMLNLGQWQVLSHSPELFFELDGERIITRPMKGTRPRGRHVEEDDAIAQGLMESAKDRAENVMIADLLRNDLGRIAETGSVHTPQLFSVEKYSTVWQLTSTVEAKTQASVPEIFRALFPCGSVTGAPKIRTMEIITELEQGPRGVYCGALGWWRPGRKARFSVAIRTVTVDTETQTAVYPTGSGITWDSDATSEYGECMQKTRLLSERMERFDLFETMHFDGSVVRRLERHLHRMQASAQYFDWPFSPEAALAAVQHALSGVHNAARVRLLWTKTGEAHVELAPLPAAKPMRVALASSPVNSSNRYLFHKTTLRKIYNDALERQPNSDDVLLYNERMEITESCRANVVVTLDGKDYTPPLDCGLLPGCMRAELLEQGLLSERVISVEDLGRAEKIRLINSLRGWMEVELLR